MGGLIKEWLWPYKLRPTRFFKSSNGLLSETRPCPMSGVIRYLETKQKILDYVLYVIMKVFPVKYKNKMKICLLVHTMCIIKYLTFDPENPETQYCGV